MAPLAQSGANGRRLDDSNALATAEPATLEDDSAGGREHPFEEAVLALSGDALGLVSTLGHANSVLQAK